MSIGQVHYIRKRAALSVSQADAVLQDNVGGIVLLEDGEHFLRACFCIHLIKLKHCCQYCPNLCSYHLSSSVPEVLVLKMWMIGDWPPSAQLDPSHELHTPTDSIILLCVLLEPLHQVHCVRVIELTRVLHLFNYSVEDCLGAFTLLP